MSGKKKQTVGYKYYLGMHMILCHGPIDHIRKILVDSKIAWKGLQAGGTVVIAAEGLFGGESSEGGVSGAVDLEMGGDTQTPNTYLSSLLTNVPGFRGVFGMVLKHCYLGMNPYLKRWSVLAQRIHIRQNGITQWYDAKAAIPVAGSDPTIDPSTYITEGYLQVLEYTAGSVTFPAADVSDTGSGTWTANFEQTQSIGLFDYRGAQTSDQEFLSRTATVKFDKLWSLFIRAEVADDPNTTDLPYNSLNITYDFLDYSGNIIFQIKITTAGPRALRMEYGDPATGLNTAAQTAAIGDISPNSFIVYGSLAITETTITYTPVTGLGFGLFNSWTFTCSINSITHLRMTQEGHFYKPVGVGDYEGGSQLKVTSRGLDPNFGGLYDMNPAHIIRECLTDPDWGMGYSEFVIDDTAFTNAADTLYSEGFGLSEVWSQQVPIEDFVKEVLKTIDASLYVDRATGKFVLKLIRDDYDISSLPLFNETNISKVDDFSTRGFEDLYNSLTLKYVDSVTSKDAATEVQDVAQIQMQGAIVGTTVTYGGISNATLASKVAARDLKVLSAPLITCSFTSSGAEAQALNVGSVFKFTWALYDVANVVLRVAKISYGDGKNNQVKIQAVQDVFGMPNVVYTSTDPSAWTDIVLPPTPVTYQIAFEIPYYELAQLSGSLSLTNSSLTDNPELGYVAAAAVKPAGAINARLYTDAGASYIDRNPLDFCPTAVINAVMDRLTTTVALTGASNISLVVIGTHVQIDDEIMVVTAISDTSLSCGRGALDTVPADHSIGARLYFWDRYYGQDGTEYTLAEVVDLKVLPITGLGPLSINDATAMGVTLNQRAIRPYPPGNFKIAGLYFPTSDVAAVDFEVTWAHRDRLLQTSPTLASFLDTDIGPEAGTTYNGWVYDADTNTLLDSVTGVSGTSWSPSVTDTCRARVEIEAERDGIASWQKQSWTFQLIGTDGRIFEDDAIRRDEFGNVRGLE